MWLSYGRSPTRPGGMEMVKSWLADFSAPVVD